MTKERNIRLYQAAYRQLEQIKPEGVQLEDYFYGDNRDYTSLKEVYISFISSAQNYQRMPNVIAFNKRKAEISEILHDYDLQYISEMHVEKLYKEFRERFKVTTPDNKYCSWYKWSCSVVDSAKFVNGFKDAADFDEFVKRFDYNTASRMALPLLIQSRIRGIGFALACDLLKELGYTNYPKPDVHMTDVFHAVGLCAKDPISAFDAIEKMAEDCRSIDPDVTPYRVDKVFWLICSGNYYNETPPVRIKGRKKELIEYLINTAK